jgi:mono/diheme cytochrome c family protein
VECHGAKVQTNGLNLSSAADLSKGSESGPVIVPGKPDESLLYRMVSEGKMPFGKPHLSDTELSAIRIWIAQGASQAIRVRFEADIRPIFTSSCMPCHDSRVHMKGLDLSTREAVMKGNDSGPAIVPGKPEESRLYELVRSGAMPKGKPHLSDQQVATIREWILAGATADSGAVVTKLSQHDVIPVLLLRCAVCHGARRHEGGLDLRSKTAMLRGGKSGPAIVPGKPEESLLIKKVESGEMPPTKMMLEVSVRPITKTETDTIASWIAQGAPEKAAEPDLAGTDADPLVTTKDRQFWAFQPPRAVEVPKVRSAGRVRNPIDAFILQQLETKGLALSKEADRLTLIRRVTYDLTGMAPEPADVQAFLKDPDPNAYEKVIDRLLASPRYGERWGRYWLDAAGYADSEGKLNADPIRPTVFRYRDYVIRSLNADKPYDRFLLEQIAGDELADTEHAPVVTQGLMDNLIATGFLSLAADATNQRDMGFAIDREDVIADEMDILGSTVMGLTIRCARCHNHKYDPIPQRDYYRLVDIFKGAYDEYNWVPPLDHYLKTNSHGRNMPYVTPGATPLQLLQQERDRDAADHDIQQRVDTLKTELKEKEDALRKKLLDARIREVPEELRRDVQTMLGVKPEKRTPAQVALGRKFEKQLKLPIEELKQLDLEFRRRAEDADRQTRILESARPPEPTIRALWDRGDPSPTYMLRRGSESSFGPQVTAGIPAMLADPKAPFQATPPWPGSYKTGRRLAFARWLVRPENPLTARVMVNRLWAKYFDAGIVKSVENFGHSGTAPTYPELLDWLAREFVRSGWSLKSLHRLIVTSSTYRQSSAVTPNLEKLDPDNKLVSRMPLKRMDAEALYDSLIQVSGTLDETRFGYPSPVLVRGDGSVTPIRGEKGYRRSIYVLQRRKDTPTLLANFDFPQMSPHCLQRSESTVAPQALYLMNDSFVRELADQFAARVEAESGTGAQAQVERMFWIALGRPPSAQEKTLGTDFLQKARAAEPARSAGREALATLCHSLFNTAAFLYID